MFISLHLIQCEQHTHNTLQGVYLAVIIDISLKMRAHAQKLAQNCNKEFHFSWLAIYNSSTNNNSFDNNKNTIDAMGRYTLFLFNNRILLHKENGEKVYSTLFSSLSFPSAIESDQMSLLFTNSRLEFTSNFLLTFNYFFEENVDQNNLLHNVCRWLSSFPDRTMIISRSIRFDSIRSNRLDNWDEQQSHSLQ